MAQQQQSHSAGAWTGDLAMTSLDFYWLQIVWTQNISCAVGFHLLSPAFQPATHSKSYCDGGDLGWVMKWKAKYCFSEQTMSVVHCSHGVVLKLHLRKAILSLMKRNGEMLYWDLLINGIKPNRQLFILNHIYTVHNYHKCKVNFSDLSSTLCYYFKQNLSWIIMQRKSEYIQ